jgi:serine/threonine protein phosphatase PrpC
MHVFAHPFWTPKKGNSHAEYEDAYWPRMKVETRKTELRFALGDGATETSFSALWAQLLVRGYCRGRLWPENIEGSLPKLRRQWQRLLNTKELPWFAEEKLRSGAFASIVGLTISESENAESYGKWRSLAVGDSCLYQVRDDQLLTCFPITRSSDFNSRPILISSVPESLVKQSHVRQQEGECRSGDTFYLMSDAIACWFLQRIEANERPWEFLRDLDTIDQRRDFTEWIAMLREGRSIKNDDVTVLRISVA